MTDDTVDRCTTEPVCELRIINSGCPVARANMLVVLLDMAVTGSPVLH